LLIYCSNLSFWFIPQTNGVREPLVVLTKSLFVELKSINSKTDLKLNPSWMQVRSSAARFAPGPRRESSANKSAAERHERMSTASPGRAKGSKETLAAITRELEVRGGPAAERSETPVAGSEQHSSSPAPPGVQEQGEGHELVASGISPWAWTFPTNRHQNSRGIARQSVRHSPTPPSAPRSPFYRTLR